MQGVERWPLWWWGALVTGIAAVAVVHFIEPEGPVGQATYLLVTVGAPVVGAIGTRRRPPGQRLVPGLVTLGLATFTVGDLVWFADRWFGGVPQVSLADAFWTASYLGLGAALFLTVVAPRDDVDEAGGELGATDAAGPRRRIDVDAVIDSLTVVVVAVIVLWTVLVGDLVGESDVSATTRVVRGAYPVLDAVLLALAVRALLVRRTRAGVGLPLALGVAYWMAADIGYLVFAVSGANERTLDVLWMLGCSLMAVSVWIDTPVRPATVPAPSDTGHVGRLSIATLPLLVPAALAVVESRDDSGRSTVVLLAGFLALLGLAFARTHRQLRSETTARQETALARDAALAASRAKSEFLTTMSHEIRTPMNGVLGLTALLLTTELTPEQRQYAEGVRVAGDTLLALIDDILDLSKVEAGRIDLESIDFVPALVVTEAASLVSDQACRRGVTLEVDVDADAALTVRGDPGRLRQVVVNLLSNAVKFTTDGSVTVTLTARPVDLERAEGDAAGDPERAPDGDPEDGALALRLEVVDTGIGIDPDARARIFAPFTQADSSTTREYGGTGLGLAISRRLVDAMGGTLDFDSRPGEGSTFWVEVTLPRVAAPVAAALAESLAEHPAEPAGPPGPAPARPVDALVPALVAPGAPPAPASPAPTATVTVAPARPRVLVVDDDEINRVVATGMLKRLGYDADEVPGGAEALAAMTAAGGAASYAAVLMDCQMPVMDGYTVTREWRTTEGAGTPRLPIIAMTASAVEGERERCLSAGMDDYVTKPVTPASIGAALTRHALPVA